MPVPTSITDLSTTAASNSPAGADAVFPNLDDYLRAHAAFIAQLNAADATKVAKAGDTMTGPLVLNADPSVALGAATKGYVDTGLAAKASSSHAHSWDQITNKGLAEGTSTQDANTSLSHNFLTYVNTPNGNYWHIIQTFYGTVGATQPRMQIAVPYSSGVATIYVRYYYGGWSSWQSPEDQWTYYKSFGSNGYARMAGGLILQWGRFTRTVADQGVSFPMVFPNACLSVVQTDMRNAALNDNSRTTALYPSYFISSRSDTASFDVLYQAIGY